jgi:CBS domain-containing protein
LDSFEPFLRPDAPLIEAAKMIALHETDVLVLDGGSPVGIVRNEDVINAVVSGKNLGTVSVSEAMAKPVPVVREGARIKEVLSLAHHMRVRKIYVSNGKNVTGHIDLDELSNLMADSWDDIEVHKALSTMVRLRIAELLSTRYMGVDQIAGTIGVKPITVRHHLEVLRRSGIIETEEVHGKIGRPRTLFKAKDLISKGFLAKSSR